MSHRLVETKHALQLSGCLLVASTTHPAPQLAQSIFLVTWHRNEGSIGVLLNRSLVTDARSLLSQVVGGSAKQMAHSTVQYGGPLAGPIIALHARPDLADAEVAAGVYVAAQQAYLKHLASFQREECRWVVGHTAWRSGELEQQIESGWWYPIPATPDLVFSEVDEAWQRAIRRVGDLSLALWTGCPLIPNSAIWN